MEIVEVVDRVESRVVRVLFGRDREKKALAKLICILDVKESLSIHIRPVSELLNSVGIDIIVLLGKLKEDVLGLGNHIHEEVSPTAVSVVVLVFLATKFEDSLPENTLNELFLCSKTVCSPLGLQCLLVNVLYRLVGRIDTLTGTLVNLLNKSVGLEPLLVSYRRT